jgi:hypothetical protein
LVAAKFEDENNVGKRCGGLRHRLRSTNGACTWNRHPSTQTPTTRGRTHTPILMTPPRLRLPRYTAGARIRSATGASCGWSTTCSTASSGCKRGPDSVPVGSIGCSSGWKTRSIRRLGSGWRPRHFFRRPYWHHRYHGWCLMPVAKAPVESHGGLAPPWLAGPVPPLKIGARAPQCTISNRGALILCTRAALRGPRNFLSPTRNDAPRTRMSNLPEAATLAMAISGRG